jgi:enoyl-CoA hydratase/carnithine racemase
MFTGAVVPADIAGLWGLVDEVVAGDGLLARVQEITEQVAAKSALVLERMKELVNQAPLCTDTKALQAELQMSDLHMASYDRNEGLAAFSEKRVPRYLDR